jgi:hypothetical protein
MDPCGEKGNTPPPQLRVPLKAALRAHEGRMSPIIYDRIVRSEDNPVRTCFRKSSEDNLSLAACCAIWGFSKILQFHNFGWNTTANKVKQKSTNV